MSETLGELSPPFSGKIKKRPARPSLSLTPSPSSDGVLPLGLQHNITKVTEDIFVSGKEVIDNLTLLDSLAINALINCCRERPTDHMPPRIEHLHLGVEDSPTENIVWAFKDCNSFIDRIIAEGGKVLIHCNAGMSRSVSVAMAYLIDRRGYSLIRSFELLKSTRKQASPNAGFMKQLALWEKAKLGVKTCSLDLEKYKNDRFASAAEVAMSNEESEDDANHVCSVELR